MSIFDKAKEKAEQLADKVKEKLDRDDTTSTGTAADEPNTISGDGAVTPADVAESVSDPDLPHPEPPSDEPPGASRPA